MKWNGYPNLRKRPPAPSSGRWPVQQLAYGPDIQGAKIGIAIGGLVLGWFCYSIASNILTYLHTLPEERR